MIVTLFRSKRSRPQARWHIDDQRALCYHACNISLFDRREILVQPDDGPDWPLMERNAYVAREDVCYSCIGNLKRRVGSFGEP